MKSASVSRRNTTSRRKPVRSTRRAQASQRRRAHTNAPQLSLKLTPKLDKQKSVDRQKSNTHETWHALEGMQS